MSRPLARMALAALALLLAPSAPGARADFVAIAILTGTQETPPNLSPGSGLATLTYEAAKDDILYNVIYANLTANAVASHIHIGPLGVAGPIVLPFTHQGPPNATSGSFSGTLTNADIINSGITGLTDISQIAAQIQLGNAYVNIHTSNFPAGEVRGQSSVVPGPSSLALMAPGLAGLGAYARSRRRVAPATTG